MNDRNFDLLVAFDVPSITFEIFGNLLSNSSI
jgi:hypothetical protein